MGQRSPHQIPPAEDLALLTVRLWCFKETLEYLGMDIHDKPGKLISPTQTIEWLRWSISTVDMTVELTPDKTHKGRDLFTDLLQRAQRGERILAKDAMATAGFLNFVASAIHVGRPFIKSLLQALGMAEVYDAWQHGRRRFNPPVTLTPQAMEDLVWWSLLLTTPPSRPLRLVAGKVFLWHQRNPALERVRRLAWSEGSVVIMSTDASEISAGGCVARTSGIKGCGQWTSCLTPSTGRS